MRNDHWQEVLGRQVQAEQLRDLVNSIRDRCLLVQDQLVDDLAKYFLSIWLDLALDANNQVVELIECFLLEVDLQ